MSSRCIKGRKEENCYYSPSFPKGLRALIAFLYFNAKRNKYVATGCESASLVPRL